jgi:hypothetical protein
MSILRYFALICRKIANGPFLNYFDLYLYKNVALAQSKIVHEIRRRSRRNKKKTCSDWFGLWCLTPLSTIFSYIVAVRCRKIANGPFLNYFDLYLYNEFHPQLLLKI